MVGTFKKRTFNKRLQKLRKTKRKHKRKPSFKKKFTKNKKRTFKKSLQKLRKTKRKHKRKPIFKKKFTKNKKKTKKIFLRKSSRKRRKHLKKYKGGFWTTCNKCMRKENCIGRACVNDCGYCTIQAFELPGINELFRDHQYREGLSQQAFIKRVNKWLKNEGYNNLTVRENTIGSDTPQPSQVAKFLREKGGDNEFIPICLGWPHGQSGHWLVGGRVDGEAVIIEPQQNPWGVNVGEYAERTPGTKTRTLTQGEERDLGLAQPKIYVWSQEKHNFIERDGSAPYFADGKPLSRLTYYTIVGLEEGGAHNIEHKIIKTSNGEIEIRIRDSDGEGNVTVAEQAVIRGYEWYGQEGDYFLSGDYYHDPLDLGPPQIFGPLQEKAKKDAIRNLQEMSVDETKSNDWPIQIEDQIGIVSNVKCGCGHPLESMSMGGGVNECLKCGRNSGDSVLYACSNEMCGHWDMEQSICTECEKEWPLGVVMQSIHDER